MLKRTESTSGGVEVVSGGLVCPRYWTLLSWMFLLSALIAAQDPSYKLEGPFPAHPGETCVVCNSPATAADVAYVVDGQRVAIKKEMEAAFLANPTRYLRAYKPEGMLFSGRAIGEANWALFFAGAYVLAGLLFGSLSAQLAMRKGLRPSVWFVYGLFANVFAWMALRAQQAKEAVALPAGLRKVQTTADPLTCLHCGSANHPLARKCLHCGSELTPDSDSEASRSRMKETGND